MEAFLPEQDAAIGRLLRAYGELEYHLGGLFISLMKLQYGCLLDDPSSAKSIELEKALGASLGDYHTLLKKHFRVDAGSTQEVLVDRLCKLIEMHSDFRNAACHGVWRRGADEIYVISFWSRKAVKALRTQRDVGPEVYKFSHAEICGMIDELDALAGLIRDLRESISGQSTYSSG